MRILAISGSARAASTNTALLRALQGLAPEGVTVELYDRIAALPVFSPDRAADPPASVRAFISRIAAADGLVIASPEYVHAIPGGLKNAIDWLVAGEAVVDKPAALIHGSHRGDDMLASLRLVLATVTARFAPDIFLRVPVLSLTPDEVASHARAPETRAALSGFLADFVDFCAD